MASLPRWSRVWVNSGSWWWTGRRIAIHGVAKSRTRLSDWTELSFKDLCWLQLLGGIKKQLEEVQFSSSSGTLSCCSLLWEHGIVQSRKPSESHLVMSDSLWSHGLYSPGNSPGQNTGVSSLSFLQWIFPTQESIHGLLHCRQILYQLSYEYRAGPMETVLICTILEGVYSQSIGTKAFQRAWVHLNEHYR